jgi:hypothetical protein
VRSLARLQFVMNIDEQLFASFAPRRLKRALAKSAELVVTSLPTFHGLDPAPVLKLIAALTMVGCLVGTIVMPESGARSNRFAVQGCRRRHASRRSTPGAFHVKPRDRAGSPGARSLCSSLIHPGRYGFTWNPLRRGLGPDTERRSRALERKDTAGVLR